MASKLEDGNFKAALRLICSDDTPALDNQDTFQALLDKHPQAPEDRKPFQDPKESSRFTPFQASFSDVSKALRSFPLGSSGGPDGVTPRHLRDLINNNADVMLFRTSEPERLFSGRTSEPERLLSGRTSEPGATAVRTNKRTKRTSQTRVTPTPFDNYSVRRSKRFCMNSDNIKLRFYDTFFDEMKINNF